VEAPEAAAGFAERVHGCTPRVDVFESDFLAVDGDVWLIPWFWFAGFAAADTVAAFEFDDSIFDIARVHFFTDGDDSDEVAVAGFGPFTTVFDASGDSDWVAGFELSHNGFESTFEGDAINAGCAWFGGGAAEATIAE